LEQAAEKKRLQEGAEKEAEKKRLQEAAENKRLDDEAEKRRLEKEAEKKRLEDEAAKKRLEDEAEKKRREAEAEKGRSEDEAEKKRLEEEAERKRLEEMEKQGLEAEAEQRRLEEAAEKRLERAAERQRLKEEGAKHIAEEQAKRHAEDEARQNEEKRNAEEEQEVKRRNAIAEEQDVLRNAEKKKAMASSRSKPRGFSTILTGPVTNLLENNKVVTRMVQHEEGFFGSLIDGIGNLTRESGVSTAAGRTILYHARKKLADIQDDGCTVITDMPMQKFEGLGQFAEITIVATNDQESQGCVGLGVTRLSPKTWQRSGLGPHLPKRLESFPAPSWIFSGPYRGTNRKLYVDGEVHMKFPCDDATQWKPGDKLGVLVQTGGRLSLHVNGVQVASAVVKGLAVDLETTDVWMVAEAYGYVYALSLNTDARPAFAKR